MFASRPQSVEGIRSTDQSRFSAKVGCALPPHSLLALWLLTQVLQAMKSKEREGLTTVGLRKKAAEFARATVQRQSADFRRYGVWGNFERPYLTLQPEYEAAQIEVQSERARAGRLLREDVWGDENRGVSEMTRLSSRRDNADTPPSRLRGCSIQLFLYWPSFL